jgi:hypothetical protein
LGGIQELPSPEKLRGKILLKVCHLASWTWFFRTHYPNHNIQAKGAKLRPEGVAVEGGAVALLMESSASTTAEETAADTSDIEPIIKPGSRIPSFDGHS